MASSYSTRLRLELPATGEQAGTWGATTNLTLGTLLEDAIAGWSNITIGAGDYTLSTANGSADEARRAVLNATGSPTGARNVIIPTQQKIYTVINACGQALTIKTAGGTGAVVPAGVTQILICDGTNVQAVTLGYSAAGTVTVAGGLAVGGALSVTGTTTLGAAGGAVLPLIINAQTGASVMDLRGRVSDGASLYRFLSSDGTAEYARVVGSSTLPFALQVGTGGATLAWSVDTSGNTVFSRNVTVNSSFTLTANLSGTVAAPVGSVSAPSVRVGSEQSGFYYTTAGYLHVAAAGVFAASFRSNGDFTAAGNVFYTSDRRLKRKLRRIRDPLSMLAALAAYHYEKKAIPGAPQIGLMAQDAQAADEALVSVGADGFLTLNVGGVLALAVGAINQLQERVAKLEAQRRG